MQNYEIAKIEKYTEWCFSGCGNGDCSEHTVVQETMFEMFFKIVVEGSFQLPSIR